MKPIRRDHGPPEFMPTLKVPGDGVHDLRRRRIGAKAEEDVMQAGDWLFHRSAIPADSAFQSLSAIWVRSG